MGQEGDGGSGPGGTAPGWSVSPGSGSDEPERTSFTFEVFPGQVLDDTVTITNQTDEPMDFVLWSGDGYNTEDGAFAIYGEEVEPSDTGAWVELPVDTLTVNPRSRADIPFQIRVPENAEPGDHAGGIAALNTESSEQIEGQDADLDILRAVGSRVYIRVAGELRQALDIRDVKVSGTQPIIPFLSGGEATVEYEVVNTGNIRLAPETIAELDGPFGLSLKTGKPVQLRELLPGSSITVRQEWDDVPPLGRLTARLSATGGEAQITREHTLWAIPWLLILVIIGLTAGFIVRRLRRRRGGPEGPAGSPAVRRELVDA
jgi:hypothetical protein